MYKQTHSKNGVGGEFENSKLSEATKKRKLISIEIYYTQKLTLGAVQFTLGKNDLDVVRGILKLERTLRSNENKNTHTHTR